MTKSTLFILITSFLTLISPGLYGMLGSAGFYAHELTQNPSLFQWRLLLIYCFLGVVVGFMANDLVLSITGHSWPGFIIAAGFSVRKITDVADTWLNLGLKKR